MKKPTSGMYTLTFVNTVDGSWSKWSDWAKCSVTCGGGVQSRNRTCANPTPAYGGETCAGSSHGFRSCGNAKCPGWFVEITKSRNQL